MTATIRQRWARGGLAVAVASWAATTANAQVPSEHPRHITPKTIKAIEAGRTFLARSQSSQGSWRNATGYAGDVAVTMTALSGLALLGAGSTPTEGPYAPNISRAVSYVLKHADPRTGLIASIHNTSRPMYCHGFSMLFLAQVYGMEEDPERQGRIKVVLDRGVALTSRSQSKLGGWLYTPDSNGDEGSVTVTQVQALRACRNAGIEVPKKTIDEAMQYLDKSAQADGGIAYRVGMSGSRPPITAAAVACWYNAGMYDYPLAKKALSFCRKHIGVGGNARRTFGHYFYSHLYYAQVMYLSGDKHWDDYFPGMRDRLLATQASDGSWQGDGVGNVYGTAIALVILQLPYQYLPIMQR